MRTVEILNQTYPCATEWNRLSPKQALYISGAINHFMILSSLPDAKHEELHANLRWQVTLGLLDITVHRFERIRDRLFKKHGTVSGANQLAALISEIANPFLEGKTLLTRNHLPTISWPVMSKKKYYGPADLLQNLTIEEFAYADSMFMHHWQKPNEDYIDGLIAILWREKNPEAEPRDPDQRQSFQKQTFVADAKAFRTLRPAVKNYIFMFYKGCRTKIEQTFTNLFPPQEPQEGAENKTVFNSEWPKVIAALTEKITEIETVRKTNLWDFLGHMDKQIADARKREMQAALKNA